MNLNDDKTNNIMILLTSSKGAQSRRKIIKFLLQRPQNCNQIANHVDLEWWTVQKHLTILIDNKIVIFYQIGKVRYYKVNQVYEETINLIKSKNSKNKAGISHF